MNNLAKDHPELWVNRTELDDPNEDNAKAEPEDTNLEIDINASKKNSENGKIPGNHPKKSETSPTDPRRFLPNSKARKAKTVDYV